MKAMLNKFLLFMYIVFPQVGRAVSVGAEIGARWHSDRFCDDRVEQLMARVWSTLPLTQCAQAQTLYNDYARSESSIFPSSLVVVNAGEPDFTKLRGESVQKCGRVAFYVSAIFANVYTSDALQKILQFAAADRGSLSGVKSCLDILQQDLPRLKAELFKIDDFRSKIEPESLKQSAFAQTVMKLLNNAFSAYSDDGLGLIEERCPDFYQYCKRVVCCNSSCCELEAMRLYTIKPYVIGLAQKTVDSVQKSVDIWDQQIAKLCKNLGVNKKKIAEKRLLNQYKNPQVCRVFLRRGTRYEIERWGDGQHLSGEMCYTRKTYTVDDLEAFLDMLTQVRFPLREYEYRVISEFLDGFFHLQRKCNSTCKDEAQFARLWGAVTSSDTLKALTSEEGRLSFLQKILKSNGDPEWRVEGRLAKNRLLPLSRSSYFIILRKQVIVADFAPELFERGRCFPERDLVEFCQMLHFRLHLTTCPQPLLQFYNDFNPLIQCFVNVKGLHRQFVAISIGTPLDYIQNAMWLKAFYQRASVLRQTRYKEFITLEKALRICIEADIKHDEVLRSVKDPVEVIEVLRQPVRDLTFYGHGCGLGRDLDVNRLGSLTDFPEFWNRMARFVSKSLGTYVAGQSPRASDRPKGMGFLNLFTSNMTLAPLSSESDTVESLAVDAELEREVARQSRGDEVMQLLLKERNTPVGSESAPIMRTGIEGTSQFLPEDTPWDLRVVLNTFAAAADLGDNQDVCVVGLESRIKAFCGGSNLGGYEEVGAVTRANSI